MSDVMDGCFELIVEFHSSVEPGVRENLIKEFEATILERVSEDRTRISLPMRDFMGTADLEDLLECKEVKGLYWDDGSVCRPRG